MPPGYLLLLKKLIAIVKTVKIKQLRLLTAAIINGFVFFLETEALMNFNRCSK